MTGAERTTHFLLMHRGPMPCGKPFRQSRAVIAARPKRDGLVCFPSLPWVESWGFEILELLCGTKMPVFL